MNRVLLPLSLCAAFAAGCNPSDTAASGADRLTIISPHSEHIRAEFTYAFRQWYRNRSGREVSIDWLDQGGTSDDVRYIRSEFARRPEGIDIDIFWGGGTDPYIEMKRRGFSSPYKLPADLLARVPKDVAGIPVYDPEFHWYGAALSGFGILYNKPLRKQKSLPVPETWEDLGRPELFGLVASGDPRNSGSAHMAYEIMLQAYGWEKGYRIITRMGANIRSFSRGSSEVPKNVSLGEAVFGLAIDFYAWAQIARDGADKIGFVLPKGVTVVNPDSMCILRGAPHVDAARAFVEFVMSDEGQRLWLLRHGTPGGPREHDLARMAVLPHLYDEPAANRVVRMNPAELTALAAYDPEKGSARWSALNGLLGAAVIDTHDELRRAWQAVVAGGMKPEWVERLTCPPVSEDEFMRIARTEWAASKQRNERVTRWAKEFLSRYQEVAAKAGG